MIVLIAIAVILILSYIYLCYDGDLPGPWNLPILGFLHKLNTEAPDLGLTKFAQKYGPIYKIKLGTVKTVVVSDAELLKKIFLKNETIGRPPLYLMKLIFRKEGLGLSEQDMWKSNRKFAINFLNISGATKVSNKKKIFEDLITKYVKNFVQNLKSRNGSVSINPSHKISFATFQIMSVLFIGELLDNKLAAALHENLLELTKLTTLGKALNFLPFLRFLPSYQLTIKTLLKSVNKYYNTLNKIIKDRKHSFPDTSSTTNLIDAYFFQDKSDQTLSIEVLQSILFELLGASTETTAITIGWALLYLTAHENVQEKVRQELDDVLQGRTPEIDDLSQLPYTRATLAEVLRLRPVFPIGFSHYALEDITVDNYKIKKNTMILPLLWAIHMDPNTWKEPKQFRSERFLTDSGEFYYPNSYLPFQTGKRMCFGDDLANIVIFLFVAFILQNFKLERGGSNGVLDLKGVCGLPLMPKPQEIVFKKIKD